jgi:hypothetical protein
MQLQRYDFATAISRLQDKIQQLSARQQQSSTPGTRLGEGVWVAQRHAGAHTPHSAGHALCAHTHPCMHTGAGLAYLRANKGAALLLLTLYSMTTASVAGAVMAEQRLKVRSVCVCDVSLVRALVHVRVCVCVCRWAAAAWPWGSAWCVGWTRALATPNALCRPPLLQGDALQAAKEHAQLQAEVERLQQRVQQQQAVLAGLRQDLARQSASSGRGWWPWSGRSAQAAAADTLQRWLQQWPSHGAAAAPAAGAAGRMQHAPGAASSSGAGRPQAGRDWGGGQAGGGAGQPAPPQARQQQGEQAFGVRVGPMGKGFMI